MHQAGRVDIQKKMILFFQWCDPTSKTSQKLQMMIVSHQQDFMSVEHQG